MPGINFSGSTQGVASVDATIRRSLDRTPIFYAATLEPTIVNTVIAKSQPVRI
jgi:hypothetical protein